MTQRTKLLIVSPLFPSPALPHNGIEESQLLAWLQHFGFAPRVVVPLPLWRSPLHGRVRRVPAIERSGAAVVVHPRYVGVSKPLTARGHGKRLETWLYRRALRAALDARSIAVQARVCCMCTAASQRVMRCSRCDGTRRW